MPSPERSLIKLAISVTIGKWCSMRCSVRHHQTWLTAMMTSVSVLLPAEQRRLLIVDGTHVRMGLPEKNRLVDCSTSAMYPWTSYGAKIATVGVRWWVWWVWWVWW